MPTECGYAKHIVVREEFVLHVPEGLDLAKAGPLVCAGATTYSPLRTWNIGPDSRVGVMGMGGVGHMAIKLASAMGAKVIQPDRRKCIIVNGNRRRVGLGEEVPWLLQQTAHC